MQQFRAAPGQLPIGYVQILRVEGAKVMLEIEHLPVADNESSVAYDEPSLCRRVFKPEVGAFAAAYRKKFA